MPTGSLTISHNFAGETDFIIAVWKKSSVPLVEVGRQAYPAPHSQQSLLIEHLDPDWYFIKFYRSAGGVLLDQEILTLAGNARSGFTYPITRYEYIVDRGSGGVVVGEVWSDPVAGSIQLRDERLKDKEYWVEERGTGTFLRIETTDRSDVGGGFDLAVAGKTFETDGIYIVFVIEAVEITGETGGGSGGGYNDVVLLVEDQDFDIETMAGKLLVAQYPTTIGLLSMPSLATISDCKFKIQTHGNFQSYLKFQLDAEDMISFLAADYNVLYLGVGEVLEVLIKANQIYVLDYDGEYRRLGQRIWGDKLERNSVYRDGTQYDQSAQPRLMQFVDTLPGGSVVSEATWISSQVISGKTIYPNKGLFARDDVNGKIRVPDSRNKFIRALANVTGAVDAQRIVNKPGGYQIDMVGPHTHSIHQGNSYTGGGGPGVVGRGANSPNTFQSDANTGVEDRPENEGLLPLLII